MDRAVVRRLRNPGCACFRIRCAFDPANYRQSGGAAIAIGLAVAAQNIGAQLRSGPSWQIARAPIVQSSSMAF
jgi:hypothetical protein